MVIAYKHLARMPNGDTEIARRGIRVYAILGVHRSGDTAEEIAEDYDLPLGAVYEALSYATDNPEEMEAIRQAEGAIERDVLMRVPEDLRGGLVIP